MNTPKLDNSALGTFNKQNLSCNWTGTSDFGRIVPFHVTELVGKDKIEVCKPRIEMQMLPIASPTFGKIDLYVHYFFVPLRLIWSAARDVLTGQGARTSEAPPTISTANLTTWYASMSSAEKRGIYKHLTSLGLPPFFHSEGSAEGDLSNQYISMLPFRAYQRVWWDFYRDPELLRDSNQAKFIWDTSGVTNLSLATPSNPIDRQFVPRTRSITNNWIADLFTSGGASPTLNYAGLVAEITGDDEASVITALDGTTSAQLRRIEAVTRLAERMALSGKRQIDALYARYGIRPKWDELNLCQYLGGAKETVLISDITSTADTVKSSESINVANGSPLGEKAGNGYLSFDKLNIQFEAQEPGYLIGNFSVMPHVHFVQGLDKMWKRNQVDDFFQKQLELTGQVAVSKQEIGVKTPNSPNYSKTHDGSTFAFTQPYYEYKVGRDILAGDFMKYHGVQNPNEDDNYVKQLQFMQSMEMYIDYPTNRDYNADNMLIDPYQFNKVFYYQGGRVNEDVDDHFMLCIDKEVVINRPMEGYAIPTIETTQEPHVNKQSLPTDRVL